MWVIYFNIGAERASRLIASSDDPGRLARNGYTYLHILIVAGIIVAAVGDDLALHHPGRSQRHRHRRRADRRAGALSARQPAVQAPVGAQPAAVASGRAWIARAADPGRAGHDAAAAVVRHHRGADRRRGVGIDLAADSPHGNAHDACHGMAMANGSDASHAIDASSRGRSESTKRRPVRRYPTGRGSPANGDALRCPIAVVGAAAAAGRCATTAQSRGSSIAVAIAGSPAPAPRSSFPCRRFACVAIWMPATCISPPPVLTRIGPPE